MHVCSDCRLAQTELRQHLHVCSAGLGLLSVTESPKLGACATAHALLSEGVARHVVCMSGVAIKQIWSSQADVAYTEWLGTGCTVLAMHVTQLPVADTDTHTCQAYTANQEPADGWYVAQASELSDPKAPQIANTAAAQLAEPHCTVEQT